MRKVRLVSMPSTNRFNAQDDAYKESVLPAKVTRRSPSKRRTRRLVALRGLAGADCGHRSFRRLGSAKVLFPQFGFTATRSLRRLRKC